MKFNEVAILFLKNFQRYFVSRNSESHCFVLFYLKERSAKKVEYTTEIQKVSFIKLNKKHKNENAISERISLIFYSLTKVLLELWAHVVSKETLQKNY